VVADEKKNQLTEPTESQLHANGRGEVTKKGGEIGIADAPLQQTEQVRFLRFYQILGRDQRVSCQGLFAVRSELEKLKGVQIPVFPSSI